MASIFKAKSLACFLHYLKMLFKREMEKRSYKFTRITEVEVLLNIVDSTVHSCIQLNRLIMILV